MTFGEKVRELRKKNPSSRMQVSGYILQGYSVDQIASIMGSDINLAALKAADLSRRGCSFHPQEYSGKFLRG